MKETYQIGNMQQWWQLFGRNGHFNTAFVQEIDVLVETSVAMGERGYPSELWALWTAPGAS